MIYGQRSLALQIVHLQVNIKKPLTKHLAADVEIISEMQQRRNSQPLEMSSTIWGEMSINP